MARMIIVAAAGLCLLLIGSLSPVIAVSVDTPSEKPIDNDWNMPVAHSYKDNIDADLKMCNARSVQRVLALGNPGSGKSLLVNTLLGGRVFESRFRASAVTLKVEVAVHCTDEVAYIVYNIPGFLDVNEATAKLNAAAIESAIRDRADIPVSTLFVLTVDGGRVRNEDIVGVGAILRFVPDIVDKTAVAILVNKVDRDEQTPEYELELRSSLKTNIPGDFNVYLLPKLSKAETDDHSSAGMLEVGSLVTVALKDLQPKVLKISKDAKLKLQFEELKGEIEQLRKQRLTERDEFARQIAADAAKHQEALANVVRDNNALNARRDAEHRALLARLKKRRGGLLGVIVDIIDAIIQ